MGDINEAVVRAQTVRQNRECRPEVGRHGETAAQDNLGEYEGDKAQEAHCNDRRDTPIRPTGEDVLCVSAAWRAPQLWKDDAVKIFFNIHNIYLRTTKKSCI